MRLLQIAALAAAAALATSSANAVDSYMFGFTPFGTQTLSLNGGAIVLQATGTGWYDNTGAHNGGNPDYIVGNCAVAGCNGTDGEYHDYFVFDLSTVSVPITSASLSIGNNTGGFGGVPATYTNWDVSTAIATLEASQSGATGIWADLASGVNYASTGVGFADNGMQVAITLDAAAVAAINADAGGQWAVGGTLSSVPEPATWAMMLIGFAGLGYAGYRRTLRRAALAA
jgi:PEP-CTERM motif